MAVTAAPVRIHTLGHSRHGIARFIELVRAHGIAVVADVRGQPYSRYNPQFNRETFRDALEAAGIEYRWFGDRLSGRPRDPDFYGPDGKVLWDRLENWPALHEGLAEVLALADGTGVALVCAEENPMTCHRRFLLTPPLIAAGAEVLHIRGDGAVETEDELLIRERKDDDGQLDLFGAP